MPGWDSLEAVTRIHGAAQIAGAILLAILVLGAFLLVRQLRRSGWPEWIDVGRYQVRSLAFEIAGGALLALLIAAAVVSYGYGIRQNTLTAAAEQVRAAEMRRSADETRARQAEETQGRQADEARPHQTADSPAPQQADEFATLQRKLSEAESQRTDLQQKLSESEKRVAELQSRPPTNDNQAAELQRKLAQADSQRGELQQKLFESEKRAAELQRRPVNNGNVGELQRKLAETESQRAELQRKLSESEKRAAELQPKSPEAGQVAELQRKLTETQAQLAALQRKEMQKRLTEDEKKLLIEALAPFPGQKITIAARLGDEDGKALAEDLIAVFEAARWNHDGNGGISVQRWDRDPVGVEITLNETDARAGRISSGIGALINAVRKLGLSYDNTIYMNRQVPPGQALVKVGRKLPK